MTKSASRGRRWPDILIGVLVVLLLVGFGLLLLRPDTHTAGVTTTPAPAAETTSTTSSAETSTIPAAPSGATDTAPAGEPATSAQGAGTTDVATGDSATEPPTIAAAPVEATSPISSTPSTAETAGAAATPEAGATAPEAAAPTAGSAAPRSGGAVATSESRVPLRSDYRITLGTFSSATAAGNAAAPVSAIGYTVYPIDLGSQVVAQVGPFADETTARQALADIQRAYPGALLYPPRNRSLTQGGTSSDAAASTDSAATTAQAPSTPAAAPSGPTYLQVGAFDRVDSAQKLVQRLRDLGYNPTVNAPEGKKVTVLVGPYTGDAVTRTETRLSTNGLDHFRVR